MEGRDGRPTPGSYAADDLACTGGPGLTAVDEASLGAVGTCSFGPPEAGAGRKPPGPPFQASPSREP
eukprot:7351170-Pyramimonas_sp.AAC.1